MVYLVIVVVFGTHCYLALICPRVGVGCVDAISRVTHYFFPATPISDGIANADKLDEYDTCQS